MARMSYLAIVTATALAFGFVQPAIAAGMDGHWTGMLNGEKGSGQADIVVNGKEVTYSYQMSAVPVEWSKVSKSSVAFGNKIYKLTLTHSGSAKFVSQKYGNASGTLTKQ